MTTCKAVSAEDLPVLAIGRPSRSRSSRSAGVSAPLSRPVAVMKMLDCVRTLKFPLVAGTQPRAAHQRAEAHKASISGSELIDVQCINEPVGTDLKDGPAWVFRLDAEIRRRITPYNECLLTEAQRAQVEVVLVSPRNPLNIGAAAR